MAEHALRNKDDQRLAPGTAYLPPQHVEILRGGGRLANLHVVFGSKLHEALKAGAGMFRALAFIAVGKKQDNARRQIPFVLAGADKLIDDDLRAVYEVAELRFPKNEGFGKI